MSWFMVGSTIQADPMIYMGPGETRVANMLPQGYGWPWPSKDKAKPVIPRLDAKGEMIGATGDLIDLHGICFGNLPITIFLTVYYTDNVALGEK